MNADRVALADFLRARREALSPREVGLPIGGRRRTPGLRREEVAQLANMSATHYARIEQARGAHPSRPVLHGIARALRLSDQETTHVLTLAGVPPTPGYEPPQHVPASILGLIDRLPDTAAIVVDAKYDVLAWNALATALLEDFSGLPATDRNLARRFFLHPDPARRQYGLSGETEFGAVAVAHLRATAARYPRSPGVTALVDDLRTSSEFARLWESRDVHAPHHLAKTLHHSVVGTLELACDILAIPDRDQRIVLFTAQPGSTTAEALRLLGVLGTQWVDSSG